MLAAAAMAVAVKVAEATTAAKKEEEFSFLRWKNTLRLESQRILAFVILRDLQNYTRTTTHIVHTLKSRSPVCIQNGLIALLS